MFPYGVRLGGALVLAGAGACFDLAGLRAFRKATPPSTRCGPTGLRPW